MFKSDELMSRLGVSASIIQDVAIDVLDTTNAVLLTVAENKSTVVAGAVAGMAIKDAAENGIGVANSLVGVYASAKFLKGAKKLQEDYKKNEKEVKKQAGDLMKGLMSE